MTPFQMLALACGLLLGLACKAQAQSVPPIAAASDLQFALDAVAGQFKADTGQELKITYGSSGNFARQLQQGAPFELFLSADEGFVFQLADAGQTVDRGALYAVGRVVLFAPHGSPLKADAQLADLKAALSDGRVQKFAIANPEHAPYGVAAREALQAAGVWETVSPKLVYGENISQTLQYAEGGNVDAAVVALSLSTQSKGRWVLIPAELHQPLDQALAVVKSTKHPEEARRFAAFVNSAEGRAVMRRYGFVLPGEAPVK